MTSGTQPKQLSVKTKWTYGAGFVAFNAPSTIQSLFFLYFLTNVAGLNTALAGVLLLVGKVWDAINDLLIGWLSDRTHIRWGTRLPWLKFGTLPFAICFVLLWIVPNGGDFSPRQMSQFAYYAIALLLQDMAFTAMAIPYLSLTPELAQNYPDRTSLVSAQMIGNIVGGMIALVGAQVIFSRLTQVENQYLVLAGACASFSVLILYPCIWQLRRQIMPNSIVALINRSIPAQSTLWSQLQAILRNRPFLIVAGIHVCSLLTIRVIQAVTPYFVVQWMKLSEQHVAQVVIVTQLSIILMLAIWNALRQKISKRSIYLIGIPVLMVAQAATSFLHPGQVGWLYVLAILRGVGASAALLVPSALLPDVIDLDRLQSGQQREGVFYGLMNQFHKLALAIALFLIGKSLNWAGFISTTAGQIAPSQPDTALWTIRLLFSLVPVLILGLSLILAWFYPISREAHAAIREALRSR